MLLEILSVVLPIFVCAGIGFGWVKRGRPFETAFVTDLVTLVGTPCLVFSTLTRQPAPLDAFATVLGAAASCFAGFAFIAYVAIRLMGKPVRVFLPSMMLPNCGNMGLPLCLFAFGERGLSFAIIMFTLAAVLQFTVGPALAMGRLALGQLIRLPMIYAAASAFAVVGFGLPVPEAIGNVVNLIGGLTVPLMLITLGVSLARLKIPSLRVSLGFSIFRLAMGAGVGFFVAWIFGLEGPMRGAIILESAMPVAVFNYLIAQKYGEHGEQVAGMVVISTALSFVSLPFLLAVIL